MTELAEDGVCDSVNCVALPVPENASVVIFLKPVASCAVSTEPAGGVL